MGFIKKRLLSFMLVLCMMLSLAYPAVFASGLTEENLIAVPFDAMVIEGGVYYGISKSWFEENNPEGKKLFLSVEIPNSVTAIYNDGFRDSWSNEKQKRGCITNYNYDGDKKYTDKYVIVAIDFSNAGNLTTIGEQAAMGCPVEGVLDLSKTKVETIGKNAFKGCTGITGVVLPSTLKNIGSQSSGSVFYGCSSMQFVHTAGSGSQSAFELPESLEVIGNQSFYKCTGLPAGTAVTIPASVIYVGSEVFNYTPSITTIIVKTDNASKYDGKAFSDSTNKYGLGNRLTVFNNSAAKNTFKPGGSNSYKNSLTYEFTLHYGYDTDAVTQPKLYGQPVNVCKNAEGSWTVNEQYQIPEAEAENAPVGYDSGWTYNDKLLTAETILKPDGDHLYLTASFVLQNPTIEFIVDGNVIKTENTYPKLTLSNDKEHLIGVQVSHPIQNAEDADVKVKFEYKWTDVWKGGSEGPRMKEPGFGRYNLWDNPDVTNTITINGSEHERTSAGNYSGEDYGDGYYLVEVYGYYVPKTGGQWKLFYKSASTVIGADSERTVNTAYLFDIVTSAPAEIPAVSIEDITVEYGYDQAGFIALVDEQEGYTYTYQWYEADAQGQSENGRPIQGAIDNEYSIPTGKDAGNYYYYLEITAVKADNGDIASIAVPAGITVAPKTITVTPKEGQKKYFGQQDPVFEYTLSEDCGAEIIGRLEREAGEEIGAYIFTKGTLAVNNPNYQLIFAEGNYSFEIQEYIAEAVFSPEQPDGEDNWYSSSVAVTPPEGHSISIDGGKTWSTEPILLDEYDGDFEYLLRSDMEDYTNGAVAVNVKPLRVDTLIPVIEGIKDGMVYCLEARFQVIDKNLRDVTANGQTVILKDGFYVLPAGQYEIAASDAAGNSVTINAVVKPEHTFGDWIVLKEATAAEQGVKEHICSVCGYKETAEIPYNSGNTDTPQTGDSINTMLWAALMLVCSASLGIIGVYKNKKRTR